MYIRNRICSIAYKSLLVVLCGMTLAFCVVQAPENGSLPALTYFSVLSTIFLSVSLIISLFLLVDKLRKEGIDGPSSLSATLGGAAVICEVITMLTYYILLKPQFADSAAQAASGIPSGSAGLWVHLLIPLLALVDWLLFSHKGKFRFTDPFAWLLPFALYFGFITIREQMNAAYKGTESFPYYFIDANTLGWEQVAFNVAIFVLLIFVIGSLFVLADQLLGYLARKIGLADDEIDVIDDTQKRKSSVSYVYISSDKKSDSEAPLAESKGRSERQARPATNQKPASASPTRRRRASSYDDTDAKEKPKHTAQQSNGTGSFAAPDPISAAATMPSGALASSRMETGSFRALQTAQLKQAYSTGSFVAMHEEPEEALQKDEPLQKNESQQQIFRADKTKNKSSQYNEEPMAYGGDAKIDDLLKQISLDTSPITSLPTAKSTRNRGFEPITDDLSFASNLRHTGPLPIVGGETAHSTPDDAPDFSSSLNNSKVGRTGSFAAPDYAPLPINNSATKSFYLPQKSPYAPNYSDTGSFATVAPNASMPSSTRGFPPLSPALPTQKLTEEPPHFHEHVTSALQENSFSSSVPNGAYSAAFTTDNLSSEPCPNESQPEEPAILEPISEAENSAIEKFQPYRPEPRLPIFQWPVAETTASEEAPLHQRTDSSRFFATNPVLLTSENHASNHFTHSEPILTEDNSVLNAPDASVAKAPSEDVEISHTPAFSTSSFRTVQLEQLHAMQSLSSSFKGSTRNFHDNMLANDFFVTSPTNTEVIAPPAPPEPPVPPIPLVIPIEVAVAPAQSTLRPRFSKFSTLSFNALSSAESYSPPDTSINPTEPTPVPQDAYSSVAAQHLSRRLTLRVPLDTSDLDSDKTDPPSSKSTQVPFPTLWQNRVPPSGTFEASEAAFDSVSGKQEQRAPEYSQQMLENLLANNEFLREHADPLGEYDAEIAALPYFDEAPKPKTGYSSRFNAENQ